MPDKTTLIISDLLRQFIEALVKEIIFEGKPFDNQKRNDLRSFSQEEGLDYAMLEKNLKEFFETVDELKLHESKSSERLAKRLAKECLLDEGTVGQWIEAVNEARKKTEQKANKEAEEERIKHDKERQKAKNESEQSFVIKNILELWRKGYINKNTETASHPKATQGVSWDHTGMDYLANRKSASSPLTISNGKVACQDISIQGHVIIPPSIGGQKVIAIGEGAFSDCTKLVSVVIPNTVDFIGQYAFSNCTRLESVSIPNSVVEFARNAFRGCDSLPEITISHDNYRKIKNHLPTTESVHFID